MKVGDYIKVGDLIKNRRYEEYGFTVDTGVVLFNNKKGGTLKILNTCGEIDWMVTSECEVISESW